MTDLGYVMRSIGQNPSDKEVEELYKQHSVVKVAVLVGPRPATTGSSDWIGRLEAALRTQEQRPGTLGPTVRPWPFFQCLPKLPFTPRFDHSGLGSRRFVADIVGFNCPQQV